MAAYGSLPSKQLILKMPKNTTVLNFLLLFYCLMQCRDNGDHRDEQRFPFGCPLTGANEKSKSKTLKVSTAAYENVRLRESVNTEFLWELKRGFVKAVVSRAVRLRERPLRELLLYQCNITRQLCLKFLIFQKTIIWCHF